MGSFIQLYGLRPFGKILLLMQLF